MLLESPWVVQILLAVSVLTLGLESDPQNAPRVYLSFKGKGIFLLGFYELQIFFVSGPVVSEEPRGRSGILFSHMVPSGFHD